MRRFYFQYYFRYFLGNQYNFSVSPSYWLKLLKQFCPLLHLISTQENFCKHFDFCFYEITLPLGVLFLIVSTALILPILKWLAVHRTLLFLFSMFNKFNFFTYINFSTILWIYNVVYIILYYKQASVEENIN